MKLSILTLSLENRIDFRKRLCDRINPQLTPEVEHLIEIDSGQLTIGAKRNILLKRAQGEYIAFVDDDDLVSTDYINLILEAINKSNPDVIGMHLLMTTDKVVTEKTFHSLKYDHWFDTPDPDKPWLRRYFRNPNHINPVKREHAIKVGFPEERFGPYEDREYSRKLLPYLKTEEYIEPPIYYYEFRSIK